MKHIGPSDFPAWIERLRRPYHAHYFAMYSSVYDAITTEPVLMAVPLDDHMVHRGDGVFEALKCVAGHVYNLAGHLDRLWQSAGGLQLQVPLDRDTLTRLVIETVQAGRRPDCMVRIFISRGPGGFSVNPYECPRSEVYIVATALGRPFMEAHPEGARLRSSTVPGKAQYLATIKNCNYVPNVLMKKQAVDQGVDFVVGYDDRGYLTEGATENVGIVTRDGRLQFPHLDLILHGTTMLRVMDLARTLVAAGSLKAVEFANIPREAVRSAAEVLLTGTTLNVVSAVEYDGVPVGDGRPGPVALRLNDLLVDDMHRNRSLLTPVPGVTP